MGRPLNLGKIPGRGFWGIVLCAVITSVLASTVSAEPIKYTGFTITDGQLGSWAFHNARVILTFVSNTENVLSNQVIFGEHVNLNNVGTAHITIVGDDKTVRATFDPGQIFVSRDLDAQGVGFGSCSPDCSGLSLVPIVLPSLSFQPVYPLGVAHGTTGLTDDDLIHDGGFSGRSWSCFDFLMPTSGPDTDCPDPFLYQPLKTDKGDLYLYQTYQEFYRSDINGRTEAANTAFFFTDTSSLENTLPFPVFAPSTHNPSRSLTYNIFFVSDVSLGAKSFSNAKISLSFRSNPSNVEPLAGAGPNAYINKKGTARIVITKGSETINAEIAANQLYVFFNPGISSVGFGSYAPDHSLRLAYPVSLTADFSSGTQLVEAVSDIITNPNDANLYSSETQALALVTDLKQPTLLADFVRSCTAFTLDPNLGVTCDPQATPAGLMTDNGLLYIPQNLNTSLGIFWSSFNPPNDLGD